MPYSGLEPEALAAAPGTHLVLGGARSGKSAFAERMAEGSGRTPLYLATAQAFDGEMEARIGTHRARRGPDWRSAEEPLELATTLAKAADGGTCVLVDCLTLWITNLMMAERAVDEDGESLCRSLRDLDRDASVLFVSNEVGQGIVPDNAMARAFRDHAGRLHQTMAASVDHVWFVTAGLPQKLK